MFEVAIPVMVMFLTELFTHLSVTIGTLSHNIIKQYKYERQPHHSFSNICFIYLALVEQVNTFKEMISIILDYQCTRKLKHTLLFIYF